jgi:hypothetical protein
MLLPLGATSVRTAHLSIAARIVSPPLCQLPVLAPPGSPPGSSLLLSAASKVVPLAFYAFSLICLAMTSLLVVMARLISARPGVWAALAISGCWARSEWRSGRLAAPRHLVTALGAAHLRVGAWRRELMSLRWRRSPTQARTSLDNEALSTAMEQSGMAGAAPVDVAQRINDGFAEAMRRAEQEEMEREIAEAKERAKSRAWRDRPKWQPGQRSAPAPPAAAAPAAAASSSPPPAAAPAAHADGTMVAQRINAQIADAQRQAARAELEREMEEAKERARLRAERVAAEAAEAQGKAKESGAPHEVAAIRSPEAAATAQRINEAMEKLRQKQGPRAGEGAPPLVDDSAPCARPVAPRAQAAPTQCRAPPQQL